MLCRGEWDVDAWQVRVRSDREVVLGFASQRRVQIGHVFLCRSEVGGVDVLGEDLGFVDLSVVGVLVDQETGVDELGAS